MSDIALGEFADACKRLAKLTETEFQRKVVELENSDLGVHHMSARFIVLLKVHKMCMDNLPS